ncbi:hypothetical protein J2W34_005192 [Variovorax boronicumulans]|uniref:hypothetical protein n=1 Tax=Variovorax boronicumulans TaxID=436515 RepID=UPI00277FD06D|nr:hypothetical protein [Variovorax boronicumulans]MDQ0073384.1 hypothetical protein [Variovorax boronicumulans]
MAALSALGIKKRIVSRRPMRLPDDRAECTRLGAETVFDKAAEVNALFADRAAAH